MNIRKINDDLSVSPQITPQHVATLKELGFRSIISNRPDAEGANQPDFAHIISAAQVAGLETCHIPVVPGKFSRQNVTDFITALERLPKPILGFCGSGTRATILWSLSEREKGRSYSEVASVAGAAGYDISNLKPHFANTGT
jgi:sulfide:quinone oxidoreductase